MAKKIGGLGKGLGAFGLGGGVSKSLANSVRHVEAAPSAGGDKAGFVQQPVMELDLKLISANPSQPRTEFEPEAMESLRDSVKQYGVLQPVLCLPVKNILCLRRRLRGIFLCPIQAIRMLL